MSVFKPKELAFFQCGRQGERRTLDAVGIGFSNFVVDRYDRVHITITEEKNDKGAPVSVMLYRMDALRLANAIIQGVVMTELSNDERLKVAAET